MADIVLVCGGWDFDDCTRVRLVLADFHDERGIGLLVHGGAGRLIHRHGVAGEIMSPRVLKRIQGADLLAEEWAVYHRIPVWGYPITDEQWATIGRKAGPLRNQRMLDERKPTVCIAFPGGRGTADMVGRCKAAGVEIVDG